MKNLSTVTGVLLGVIFAITSGFTSTKKARIFPEVGFNIFIADPYLLPPFSSFATSDDYWNGQFAWASLRHHGTTFSSSWQSVEIEGEMFEDDYTFGEVCVNPGSYVCAIVLEFVEDCMEVVPDDTHEITAAAIIYGEIE